MSAASGVYLVTGASRGLGLETARQLCARGARVWLTARDLDKARAAAAKLKGDVVAAALDVTSEASVRALKGLLDDQRVRLAALVNNAGIAPDGFDVVVAERTLEANFEGAVRVTEALLPLLDDGGRIVNISSGAGELAILSDELQARFLEPTLTLQELRALTHDFIEAVRRGDHRTRGWPHTAYGVSKAALNAYTRILSRELASDPRGLKVNSICPGWVRTAMGGRSAPRTVDVGAAGIVWAATLPREGPSGGFFRDENPIEW